MFHKNITYAHTQSVFSSIAEFRISIRYPLIHLLHLWLRHRGVNIQRTFTNELKFRFSFLQELARLTLAELLSELAQSENEALESEDVSRGPEGEDVRFDLERSAGSMLAPRERKAGCKNFFWKTFTSC